MDSGARCYHRYLEGDDTGMVELIRDHKDGLMLYLNTFTNDLTAAEELTEDTFVKLAVRKPPYTGRASFKTWLYTIGRNTAFDHLRHRSRSQLMSLETWAEPAADEISLERSYIREETRITVHRALRRLQPAYRQILWLVYFDGFTHKEAAAVMKRSVHSIDTLVYRARLALKNQLEKEGFVYEDL